MNKNFDRSTDSQNYRRLQKIFKGVILLAIVTALMAGAYEIGGNNATPKVEQQRQTVVQEGEVITDVAEEVGQSVVSIVTQQQSRVNSFYYGPQTRRSQAAGTGVIIDENGLILTNRHVVPEETRTVEVVTSDGTRYENVEIIGRDTLNDLAILKVKNPKNFKPAKLADSDQVRTGQKVIAIGNALGQFQNTVTSGIISGMGRPISTSAEQGGSIEELTNLFQTDAAINSGNSGGPLLNFNGEVIAINTAVAADAENIGFAIPINEAKGIIESAKTTGKVTRPFLGVQYITLTPDVAKELDVSVSSGAYINKEEDAVVKGSPAEKAGLKPGDIITSVGGVQLTSSVSLASAVGRHKIGDKVEVIVLRGGKEKTVIITLAEVPNS